MKRHVIFAHKLGIGHVLRSFICAPPAFPIAAFSGILPFLCSSNVFDGGIKPDVKDLIFHSRPRLCTFSYRNTPVKIARDAPVLKPIPVIKPFFGDRSCQHGPISFAVNPCLQLIAHLALGQIKVFGFPFFQICRTRDGGAWINQIGWIKLFGAIVALIPTCVFEAAVWTGALYVTIWEITAVRGGIHLFFSHLADQSSLRQPAREMLGQSMVLSAGGAAKVVKGQTKSRCNLGLYLMHFSAILCNWLTCLCRGELCRCSMFICGTEK